MNSEDDIRKLFFANEFSSSEKRALPLQWIEQRLFQRENGFVRTFVWICLLVSGTFRSFYGFYYSQSDRPRPFCNLSAKINEKSAKLYCVISAQNDSWARLRASWPNLLLRITREDCSFIFSLRKWRSMPMKLKRTIWNFHCTFWSSQLIFRGHVPEAKMYPKLISNSEKREIRKK